MNTFISIIGLLAVVIAFLKMPILKVKHVSSSIVIVLFLVKLSGAYGLWQYYEKIEDRSNADVFKFYDDGIKIKNGILNHPKLLAKFMLQKKDADKDFVAIHKTLENWNANDVFLSGSGHRFMIRLNTLLSFVTNGNYFLHMLFYTFLGYAGIILCIKAWPVNPFLKKTMFFLMTFSPTLLFWTSGILKETITIFLLGTAIYNLASIKKGFYWSKMALVLISIVLLSLIKLYIGLGVVIAVTSLFLLYTLRLAPFKIMVIILAALFLATALNPTESQFSILKKLESKRLEFVDLAMNNKSESLIEIPTINQPYELLYKGPHAVFNVMLRPHIFEVNKRSYLPFVFENSFIVMLLFWVAFNFKKNFNDDLKYVYPSLLFILVTTLIIGLSTPVLGATVRYRAPAFFLFYGVLALLIDENKMPKTKRFRLTKN